MFPKARSGETWGAVIVDQTGTVEELRLDADQPSQITWKAGQLSPLGGRLECIGRPPDLSRGQTIRLTYHCDGHQPVQLPHMWPTAVDTLHESGDWFGVDVIDQTIMLAADGLDFGRVLPAGTRITQAMRDLAANSAPGIELSLPDTDQTLRVPMELALSSSPLDGINRLAETLGATMLAPRLDGSLACEPWRPSSERPLAATFGPGDDLGFLPQVKAQSDYLAAPNVVHYTGRGSEDSDEIIGRWLDQDAESPWSIQARGRRILATASGDAASQEIANMQARRVGLEARGRGRVATITGPWQPLTPGQVVETVDPTRPHVSARWEIIGVSWTTALGSPTTWTLQEVA